MHKKRVLLLTHDSIYSRIVLEEILKSESVQLVGIVISTCFIKRGINPVADFILFIKKVGLKYALYQFYISFMLPQIKFNGKGFKSFAINKKIPYYLTTDINSEVILKKLSKLDPDFLLSFNFNQKMSIDLIKISKIASLNIHPSYLPDYRGVDPLLFAFRNHEKTMGVSIHLITEMLDEGDILLQEKFDITSKKIIPSYELLFKKGASMAANVIGDYSNYFAKRIKQPPGTGNYFGWKDI